MNNSNLYALNLTNLKGAFISGFLAAFLSMGSYILRVGDVFAIDTHALLNAGALAGVTFTVSLIKSYLTDSAGKFVGAVDVK